MKKSIYSYVANDVFSTMSLDEISNVLGILRRPRTVLKTLKKTKIKDMLKKYNKKYTKNTINCKNLSKIQMINNIVSLIKNSNIKSNKIITNKKIIKNKKNNKPKKYIIGVDIECPDYLEHDDFNNSFYFSISVDIKSLKKYPNTNDNIFLAQFDVEGEINVETTNNGSTFYCSNPNFTCFKYCSKKKLIDAIEYLNNNLDIYYKAIESNRVQEKILNNICCELLEFIDFIENKIRTGSKNKFEYNYEYLNEYEYVKPKK